MGLMEAIRKFYSKLDGKEKWQCCVKRFFRRRKKLNLRILASITLDA
jgi:ubiquitin C-terminal hydrolase